VVNLIPQLSDLWKDAEPDIYILKGGPRWSSQSWQAAARGSKQGFRSPFTYIIDTMNACQQFWSVDSLIGGNFRTVRESP
jgi:hypothetical protein